MAGDFDEVSYTWAESGEVDNETCGGERRLLELEVTVDSGVIRVPRQCSIDSGSLRVGHNIGYSYPDASTIRECYDQPMVRPDERMRSRALARVRLRSCWMVSGGASPLPVGVGAPGSRSPGLGETPVPEAGCRKSVSGHVLDGREQARGPQHEVKPAASSDSQSGSRAAHVTVKATSVSPVPKGVAGSGGVWGVARAQGTVRNRRGPSALPLSRQGGLHKPKVKAVAEQRESEGAIVPV